MLSSLPTLFPHDPHPLWYPSLTNNPSTDQPSTISPNNPININDPHPQPPTNHHHPHQPLRNPLTLLQHDEAALTLRKTNIRRFGANWLRPPGVTKTLQGLVDERAEREEAERAAVREAAAAEAQAALEEEQAEVERLRGLEAMSAGDEGGRDLDEDVPEAEAEAEVWSDEEDDDGVDVLGEDERDEVEGDGDFVGEDAVVGVEVDLDDEVPEAGEGSYEHTDTEVEDSSSEGEHAVGMGVGGRSGSGIRRQGPLLGTFDRRTGEVVRGAGARDAFWSSPLVAAQRESGGRGVLRGRDRREN